MTRTLNLLQVLLFFIAATTRGGDTQFTVSLNGANEVPPNGSANTGFGTLDWNGTQLSYSIKVFNPMPQPTDATFNDSAYAGPGAPVVADLGAPSADPQGWIWTSGTLFLSPAVASDLMAGDWYMNVDSFAFPSGELRGPIVPAPEPSGIALFAIGIGGLFLRARHARYGKERP